jgi:hypothetical protein
VVLRHLAAGRDLALDLSGRPAILQTGSLVPRGTVDALLRRHWLDRPPPLPLLDPPVRLTARGRRALNR